MSFLSQLFRPADRRAEYKPLYAAVVAVARDPAWYREGAVPDTLDGRFDMVAAILSLVLLRLEAEGDAGRVPNVLLTETFVDDMDGQLRQIGIGDVTVGKHIGHMMSALGGRLTAYRDALASAGDLGKGDLGAALVRNLYRGEDPGDAALAFVAARLVALHAALGTTTMDALIAGRMPA